VMALVACASSLILLECMLRSWQEGGVFQKWNIGGLSYGQIITAIYLKVSVSDFLTLFSSRTGDKFFFQSTPAPILLGAATLALSTSTILACLWPESKPDGIYTIGLTSRSPHLLPLYIWIYCIVWWFIQVSILSLLLLPSLLSSRLSLISRLRTWRRWPPMPS
jgi:H+-transporting ATPase